MTAKIDNWPAITERMVAASTFTFTILLTPQLFKNLANMQAGNRAALAVLSWVIWAAGYMPNTAFWCTVALSGAAAWVNGTKALGLLDRGSLGRQTWHLWGDVTGLIGLASLPQALWMTVVGPTTMLPAMLASGGGLLLLAASRAGHLPEQMQHLWAAIPGWTATGLFMFQPVAQSMGWVQLLSMFIGRSEQGNRYLHPFVMAASTVALTLYGFLVLVRDSRSKDLPSPLHSIWSLLAKPEESIKVPDDQADAPKTA
eukprot:jgi/Astpho2/527/Aster-x0936